MIKVTELMMSLRYALGDMQGLNISDYQLIEPINQATSRLYERLSERYVHAVLKKIVMTVGADKTYALPSDFVRVHQVVSDELGLLIPTSTNPPATGAYRIFGNNFYADKGTYSLEYYYIPARVRTLADSLDVPESMRSYIEQLSLLMYRKDLANVEELLKQVESVLAGREISHFENTGPAQVFGGRV